MFRSLLFLCIIASFLTFTKDCHSAEINVSNEISGSGSGDRIIFKVVGDIEPGDAEKLANLVLSKKIINKVGRVWLRGFLDVKGGSDSEAIKIGRYIRINNGSVFVGRHESCIGACVLIFISAVERNTESGTIAIRRPYLNEKQSFDKSPNDQRLSINAFLSEMNISKEFADLMYKNESEKIYILTDEEIRLFIPEQDPVYENLMLGKQAEIYGTNVQEIKKRNIEEKKCYQRLGSWSSYDDTTKEEKYKINQKVGHCVGAALWGISLEDYAVRVKFYTEICIDRALDRNAFNVPADLSPGDCGKFVMVHGVQENQALIRPQSVP